MTGGEGGAGSCMAEGSFTSPGNALPSFDAFDSAFDALKEVRVGDGEITGDDEGRLRNGLIPAGSWLFQVLFERRNFSPAYAG